MDFAQISHRSDGLGGSVVEKTILVQSNQDCDDLIHDVRHSIIDSTMS